MNIKKAFLSLAAMTFSAAAMTVSAQTDYTSLITNPSFENGFTGWTQTNMAIHTGTNFTKYAGTKFAEKWVASGNAVGSASCYQTVRKLPNGVYTLTVGAQNLNQADTSAVCTGAYIYYKNVLRRKSVNKPNDYSISFTSTNGEMLIGFNASSATGNWLCIDNFRLTKTGEADKTLCKNSCDSLVTVAEGIQSSTMTKEPYDALLAAIAAGKATTVESTDQALSDATVALSSAIYDARNSITACTSFTTKVTTAKTYQGKYMQQKVSDDLDTIIEQASLVGNTMKDSVFLVLVKNIDAATENAKTSITAYTNLSTTITTARDTYNESKNGAAEFLVSIESAEKEYNEKATAASGIDSRTELLKKATLAFNIANATPGTGTAVAITSTYNFAPTGATQAMMRFECEGSNIKEKGICWSTSHNPTVLDDRSTEILGNIRGNIYIARGLKSATVYYLRPYVMNTTYTVAYGDEVKIVTHPMGNCSWSWDEAGPDEATNNRCRTAIKQTIDYFNEWTGIMGFNLSGHYVPGAGSGSGTADCSYGGYMRISQNTGNQAIGTVLHETGHGVGVGTQSRYWDSNVHSWKWYGSETNKIYSFLENKEADPYTSDFCWVGDNTHAWGASATYDWCINGSDKDKHVEIQYAGGCCLLYGMFVDGLCPTTAYTNGIAGYTYNFDESKKYYIMCKDASHGLGTGLITAQSLFALRWANKLDGKTELTDKDAWYIGYDPQTGYYTFKNVSNSKYLTHIASSANMSYTKTTTPGTEQQFQLMPTRTDVTITGENGSFVKKGFWFAWDGDKSMEADDLDGGLGKLNITSFNYADAATKQQWIILSEDEVSKYWPTAIPTAIKEVNSDETISITTVRTGCYNLAGQRVSPDTKGIIIINGKKILNK